MGCFRAGIIRRSRRRWRVLGKLAFYASIIWIWSCQADKSLRSRVPRPLAYILISWQEFQLVGPSWIFGSHGHNFLQTFTIIISFSVSLYAWLLRLLNHLRRPTKGCYWGSYTDTSSNKVHSVARPKVIAVLKYFPTGFSWSSPSCSSDVQTASFY